MDIPQDQEQVLLQRVAQLTQQLHALSQAVIQMQQQTRLLPDMYHRIDGIGDELRNMKMAVTEIKNDVNRMEQQLSRMR